VRFCPVAINDLATFLASYGVTISENLNETQITDEKLPKPAVTCYLEGTRTMKSNSADGLLSDGERPNNIVRHVKQLISRNENPDDKNGSDYLYAIQDYHKEGEEIFKSRNYSGKKM
jgi:hypothetical protein